jgi:hypothetical protein
MGPSESLETLTSADPAEHQREIRTKRDFRPTSSKGVKQTDS